MSTALVLVVEDSELLQRAIACYLETLGYDSACVGSAEEALASDVVDRADLAIVDVGLPQMSGIELVGELKRRRGDALPTIVMSGRTDTEGRVEAFDAGTDDFVAKPVAFPELGRRLAQMLRLRDALLDAQAARERAEQANLYASEAAALLAHDLANGLAVSLCNLEFLAEFHAWSDDEERDACSSSVRALRKMVALVNNFVEIGQLEDAAVVARPSRVGLSELLEDVAGLHRHEAEIKKARVEVSCAPDLEAEVDPVLVERMVHNLVGNAIRYVNEGGAIRMAAEVRDGALAIEVGNTGAPIPVEARGRIFEKYITSGDTRKRRGMGLYFCRLACEAHGGTISVDQRPDYPALFTVEVPAVANASRFSAAAAG